MEKYRRRDKHEGTFGGEWSEASVEAGYRDPQNSWEGIGFPMVPGMEWGDNHFNQLLEEKMSLAGRVSGPQVANLELTSLKNLPYNFHYPSMD